MCTIASEFLPIDLLRFSLQQLLKIRWDLLHFLSDAADRKEIVCFSRQVLSVCRDSLRGWLEFNGIWKMKETELEKRQKKKSLVDCFLFLTFSAS